MLLMSSSWRVPLTKAAAGITGAEMVGGLLAAGAATAASLGSIFDATQRAREEPDRLEVSLSWLRGSRGHPKKQDSKEDL
mmetsp:Transcript_6720/g.14680  ORF Transcript_6720/g.14680 Transcript_6720/m.14680 type:complete len:80 (-) Transcript_6720:115-354(-)